MNPRALTPYLRLLGMALLLGFIGYAVWRYDFETLPEHVRDLDGKVSPGALMILRDVASEDPLEVGSLVECVLEDEGRRKIFYSRVAALPGQRVELRPLPANFQEIYVDGTTTMTRQPERGAVQSGVVPQGRLLLLDPASEAGGVDSRHLGLVPRAAVRRRILVGL